jgi:hypothetical protein
MVKCGVLFEVRAGFLNIIYTSFGFKFCFGGRLISGAYTSEGIREDPVHRPDQAEGSEEEPTTEIKII